MKKSGKAFIITLIALVILAAGIFAAYEIGMKIAADKAVNVIIKSEINNMLDSGELTIEDVMQIAGTEETAPPELTEPEKEPEPEKAPEKEVIPTKKPVTPTVTDEQKKKEAVEKAAEKTNEEILASDKREVAKLIKSKLTTEDLKYLLSLLKGGVTLKELNAAADLAYERFTEEEIVRVKEFWHKYKSNIKRAEEEPKEKAASK